MTVDRDSVKKVYIKAKLYRSAALVLAVFGLVLFVYLYVKVTGGDVMVALHNPHFILFILFPFLPSAVMAWLAERLERQTLVKFEEMMKDH
jgi:hypothetical protein